MGAWLPISIGASAVLGLLAVGYEHGVWWAIAGIGFFALSLACYLAFFGLIEWRLRLLDDHIWNRKGLRNYTEMQRRLFEEERRQTMMAKRAARRGNSGPGSRENSGS